MPLSPSMNVMALLHDAVFMNAGSYVIRPNSSASTLIWRRSIARMAVSPSVPCSRIDTGYGLPVRPSLISNVPDEASLAPLVFAPGFAACVVPILRSPWECRSHEYRLARLTNLLVPFYQQHCPRRI